MNNDNTKWNWTQGLLILLLILYIGIPIKNVGVASVQAWSNKHSHCFKLIQVEKRLIENTIFVIIKKENLNQSTYLIENWSKYVSLMVFQQEASNTVDYIDVMEKMPYGVVNPDTNTNTIVWQFFVGSLQRNPQFVEDTEFKIDMEVMDRENIIKIPTGFCQGRILYMKIIQMDLLIKVWKMKIQTQEISQNILNLLILLKRMLKKMRR